jgi:hypothetical protein
MLPLEYSLRGLTRGRGRVLLALAGSVLAGALIATASAFLGGMEAALGSTASASRVIVMGAGSEESLERSEIGARVPGVLSASVQRLLQPDDVHMPLWRRCVPELSSVAMDQEMTMRLDPKNSLTLSNQAVTKHGLGGSTLRLGFKRTLSPRSTLQLSTSLSHEP